MKEEFFLLNVKNQSIVSVNCFENNVNSSDNTNKARLLDTEFVEIDLDDISQTSQDQDYRFRGETDCLLKKMKAEKKSTCHSASMCCLWCCFLPSSYRR